jgi:hypothetical protein
LELTEGQLIIDDGFVFDEPIILHEVVDGKVQLIADWETEKATMEAEAEAEQQQSEVDMLKARLAELEG